MSAKQEDSTSTHKLFIEMLKKAYEKGIGEDEISVKQLVNDIENDLKKMLVNY